MRAATTRLFSRPADLLLAAAFAGVGLTEVWVFSLGNDYSIALRVTASVLTLVACGALALRRTSPVAAFSVNAAAVVALIAAGYASDVYQWTNLVATYSIAAHGSRRAAWIALPVAVGGVLFYFLRFPDEGDAQLTGFVAAMWVVGWLVGRIYGAQVERDRLRSERDLARQLADANEERLALEEERSRIAHELHDIIGHTVNVMVVHAGAGRQASTATAGPSARPSTPSSGPAGPPWPSWTGSWPCSAATRAGGSCCPPPGSATSGSWPGPSPTPACASTSRSPATPATCRPAWAWPPTGSPRRR
jgi:signal transduction histidine kinase